MPTFCRHGRFLERCPVCSKDLSGNRPGGRAAPRPKRAAGRTASGSATGAGRRVRGKPMRIHREGRAEDDGYRNSLVPGVRASADAARLAEEIAFASGRLLGLAVDPPGLYSEAVEAIPVDLERATWICFLTAYLSPLDDGEDPFAGIRAALQAMPGMDAPIAVEALSEPGAIALGPRTSHDRTRGAETLDAYRQWVARAGGSQASAFAGDEAWTPERRFERLFERLALPGFGRMGRYELLVTLGRLGVHRLSADSLHLGGVRGASSEEATIVAAKRVFGIGDPLLLDRRAAALAAAVAVPVEALDLALANWAEPARATMGFPAQTADDGAHERAFDALIE